VDDWRRGCAIFVCASSCTQHVRDGFFLFTSRGGPFSAGYLCFLGELVQIDGAEDVFEARGSYALHSPLLAFVVTRRAVRFLHLRFSAQSPRERSYLFPLFSVCAAYVQRIRL